MLTGRWCGGDLGEALPVERGSAPASGCSKPAIIRSVVVLPQPEGPSSEKNSPAPISRSSPSTASSSPNRLTRPLQARGPRSSSCRPSGRRSAGRPGGRSWRRTGRRRRRCAAPRSATARPCPTAAGRRRGCAAPASGRGRSGRRARGSRGSCGSGAGRNETQPLAPGGDDPPGQAVPVDDVLQTRSTSGRAAGPGGRTPRREHLGQHRPGRGHRQRVAVERADLLVAAVGDHRHHLLGCRRSPRSRCRRPSPWPGRPGRG